MSSLVNWFYCCFISSFYVTGADPLRRRLLIGDSMLRDVVESLPRIRVVCKPVIKLATLAHAIFEDQRYNLDNANLVIIHAGTNDINYCSANELLDIVRSIVTKYRENFHGHIGFSTIIPRPRDGRNLSERVKNFNQLLMSFCSLNGCLCLRTHSPFLKGGRPRKQLYNKGLLHLRARGPAPSGAYILRNFLRSKLSFKILLPCIRDIEARFYSA